LDVHDFAGHPSPLVDVRDDDPCGDPSSSQPVAQPPPPGRRRRLGREPLVAERQPSLLPGGQHALGVGVPAAVAVALGREQHVVGHGVQLIAAERTAIRRRLPAPGRAHRPPAGLVEPGHTRMMAHRANHLPSAWMPTSSDTAAPDAEAERLYALDPDEFVDARDAAVKALRGDGKRAEAAAVAKLRKPSVAAWVVNRLARDEADLLGALLDAGAKLRDVQLAGAAAADLRAAITAEGKALDALMRPA